MTTKSRTPRTVEPTPDEIARVLQFVGNRAVQDIPTQPRGEFDMSASTAAKKTEAPAAEAPAFDVTKLVTGVTFSDDELKTNRGRPSKYATNPFREIVSEARKSGKVATLRPMPGAAVPEVIGYLRAAAADAEHGIRFEIPKGYAEMETVRIRFQTTDKRSYTPREKTVKTICPACNNEVSKNADGSLRTHGPRNNRCSGSGVTL